MGYQTAKSKTASWENVIKKGDGNINLLATYKIIKPLNFIYSSGENTGQLYREAVLAFIFGLHNSSVSTSMRCLEIGLRKKYAEVNQNQPPDKLVELIDWSETYLSSKKEIAHGFRILRNLIHSDTLVKQQDALEALRHVSEILNLLYPYEYATKNLTCSQCNKPGNYRIYSENCLLYNDISLKCNYCGRQIILPVIG